jgi:hypothetical protein
VRHRLNVMQGGASMAPPVARCSNGPRRAGAYLHASSAVQCFCALALPLRGRICVRSRHLARGPSFVSSGDLNGSTASPTSRAMRGPVSCLAALAPDFLYCLLSGQDKIGTEALLDQNDRLKGGGNARRH